MIVDLLAQKRIADHHAIKRIAGIVENVGICGPEIICKRPCTGGCDFIFAMLSAYSGDIRKYPSAKEYYSHIQDGT